MATASHPPWGLLTTCVDSVENPRESPLFREKSRESYWKLLPWESFSTLLCSDRTPFLWITWSEKRLASVECRPDRC